MNLSNLGRLVDNESVESSPINVFPTFSNFVDFPPPITTFSMFSTFPMFSTLSDEPTLETTDEEGRR